MKIEIATFGSKRQMESIKLRDAILRKPLGLEFSGEELNQDGDQIHIVAVEENTVVGVLLLKPLSDTEIKMRQVAVANALQGSGIGVQIVRYAEYYSRSKGYKLLSLHARENAITFYERLNYKRVGDPFDEVGIEQFRMERSL